MEIFVPFPIELFKNTPSVVTYTVEVTFAGGGISPFVKFFITPYLLIFAANVEFVRTKPCPSASSIIGWLFSSRASDSVISGFEKSTPVSIIAIVTPLPVTL